MKKLKDVNDALPDLWIGIGACGILVLLATVWFAERRLYYVIGFSLGLAAALFMAWHMAYSLEKACGFSKADATKKLQGGSLLRYAGVAVLLGILILLDFGSPIGYCVGVLMLKVSAYLAPFTHKIFRR